MSEGKRKAGFFAKLFMTSGYGLLLMTIAAFTVPETYLGFRSPPLATFLLIGLCWPVLWLFFWLAKVVTPMPFELIWRLLEVVLVGPGHLTAWILFGKRGDPEEEERQEAPAPTEAGRDPLEPPKPLVAAPDAPPPSEAAGQE